MKLPASPAKRAAMAAVVLSAVAGAIYIYSTWWAFRPHGNDFLLRTLGFVFIGMLFVMVLYNLLYLIGGVASRLIGRGKSTWSDLGAQAVFCFVTFFLCFLAVGVGNTIEHRAYIAMVRRGVPIVKAVQQYQAKNGKVPPSLDALVPDFIVAIPQTGFDVFPKYSYYTNGPECQDAGDSWVLCVDVSTDDVTREELLYWPGQKYPDNRPETIRSVSGDWIYRSTANKKSGSD